MHVLCLREGGPWALSSHGSRSVCCFWCSSKRQALPTYPLIAPVFCCPTGRSPLGFALCTAVMESETPDWGSFGLAIPYVFFFVLLYASSAPLFDV